MTNIEVELKLIVTDKQYEMLKEFFDNNANFIQENEEETQYLDCKEDLRLFKSQEHSKICLKQGGDCHDQIREETEIILPKEEFEKAEKYFKP